MWAKKTVKDMRLGAAAARGTVERLHFMYLIKGGNINGTNDISA